MDEIEKLKKENERLKILNENKSDLVSIGAHQIRTSLTAFKWTLRMFLNQEMGNINEEQKNYLDRIIDNNEYTISLVNNLLDLNHTKDVSIEPNFKPTDIINTINKVLNLFFGESKSKNINLVFEKPEKELPKVNCDESMIVIVLENLVENALKYSENNTDIKISINNTGDGKNISISVHNKGIGIKKEDEENIFNKFFRGSNAIQKDATGSGFGLFATKNIVERNGGKIWFESTDESGTTFSITLPIY